MADVATSYTPETRPSSFDSMLDPSQDQIDETITSMRRRSDQMWDKADKVAGVIEQSRLDANALEMPTMKPLPEAPTPQMRDPIQAFGSTASLLGMLASTMTRRPLTNALNAATGVMNAYRQNDLQDAKFQFDSWKANLDNAKALNDWQMDTYKAALAKMDGNSRAATAELQAYASAFKDENMLALLQSKKIADIYKYIETSNSQWTKMQGIIPKLEEFNTQQTLWTEWQQQNPNATNDEKTRKYQEIWHPAAAAAATRADRTDLTPSQEMDDARQYFNTTWPINPLTGTRDKTNADGTTQRAPEFDAWQRSSWPNVKAEFYRQRKPNGQPSGYYMGLPVAGQGPAADAKRKPTEVPNPTRAPAATATPSAAATPSDFIPVPEKFSDPKFEGKTFVDEKGVYGKPGAQWTIRGGKAYPATAAAPGGQGRPAASGGGQGGPLEEGGPGDFSAYAQAQDQRDRKENPERFATPVPKGEYGPYLADRYERNQGRFRGASPRPKPGGQGSGPALTSLEMKAIRDADEKSARQALTSPAQREPFRAGAPNSALATSRSLLNSTPEELRAAAERDPAARDRQQRARNLMNDFRQRTAHMTSYNQRMDDTERNSWIYRIAEALGLLADYDLEVPGKGKKRTPKPTDRARGGAGYVDLAGPRNL